MVRVRASVLHPRFVSLALRITCPFASAAPL